MDNHSQNDGEDAHKQGLVIVHTGAGKGKTTAALGILLRAYGQGLRACVIQFIKNKNGQWGEVKAARKLGIEWHTLGEGFTWQAKAEEEGIARAREAWELAQEKIARGAYDLVLLDEFTYALTLGWLNTAEVLGWLREHKPAGLHLIVTGRNAPRALIEYADLVTEMVNVKHPFERGVKAQRGIEF